VRRARKRGIAVCLWEWATSGGARVGVFDAPPSPSMGRTLSWFKARLSDQSAQFGTVKMSD